MSSGDGALEASRISPGLSFYEAILPERPAYEPLDGDVRADVAIVGGGFTGLSAAAHLAEAGASVVLLEAERLGDGASMRNGGQMGTGQRADVLEQESKYGTERARELFALAEEAKRHLHEFTAARGIDMRYRPGQLSVAHKARHVDEYRAFAEALTDRYGYPHATFMDREETAARLGSVRYHGGIRDTGTGHIDPAALIVGTARAAAAAGAKLCERTRVSAVEPDGAGVRIETPRGTVRADRALIAVNGYGEDLSSPYAKHVMPIRSFIGATEPLEDEWAAPDLLPGGEAVDDSRFVVRYFRRIEWPDGRSRLLFGGRETYSHSADPVPPRGLETHVRRQIAEVYPALANVPISHAWGGSVAITMNREPYVREIAPRVHAVGGFSGHGVMLSNFTGKLYAESVAGNRDRLAAFERIAHSPFPGGKAMRPAILALAMSWYALRDRF